MSKYPEEQRSGLLEAFAKEIGPQADVIIQHQGRSSKSMVDKPVSGWINPRGWSGTMRVIDALGDDWDEVYDLLRVRWAARAAQIRKETITGMALAVIELTFSRGECNDAALRSRGFCTTDIDDLGDEACAEAKAMVEQSAGHEFSIVRLGLPNVAAA